MVKRISCKVVASVPFGQSSGLRQNHTPSNRKSGNTAGTGTYLANTANSTHPDRLDITSEFTNIWYAGQLVDRYA